MTELPRERDNRLLFVVTLYVLTTAWGVAQVFSLHGGLQYLFALVIASAATLWAVSDARLRGHSILNIVQFFIFVSWPIAVPIYLVWSRGLRGLGLSLLHGVGLTVALCIGFYCTVFSVYGIDAYSAQP